MLEPSDIEEILETLVSDARLECDKQLTGSNGGGLQPAQHGALSLNTAPSRADRSTRPPRPPRSLSESPGRAHSP